jgi:hypothetical protein
MPNELQAVYRDRTIEHLDLGARAGVHCHAIREFTRGEARMPEQAE